MKCLRIYADETGESHLTDIDIPLVPVELFPGFADLPLRSACGQFRAFCVGPSRNTGSRLARHSGAATRYLADRVGGVRDE